MPLFFRKKKPSDESQKRLEYQLCWSKEAGADDILDISTCELSEVSLSLLGVVLTFDPQVLDLHDNMLCALPEDIGKLVSLQVNNYELLSQTLCECQIISNQIRFICIAPYHNKVTSRHLIFRAGLDQTLGKTLYKMYVCCEQSFTLDAAMMTYPPAHVCTEGTESIQRFLCSELGEEYCSPSQYLLPVLENDCGKQSCDCWDGLEEAWQTKFSDYTRRKEQKQEEKLAFERHLEEKQREHTQLLLSNNSRKEGILNSVRQEQERLEQGVSQQQRAQEAERMLMLERVRQAEESISNRVSNMLRNSSRQKKSTEFLQAMEEDRIRLEHLTAITQEETNSLRKREVAAAMQKMLSDSCAMSLLQEASDYRRQSLVSEAYRSKENLDRKFDSMLSLQALDKSKAIAQILQEEEMQKAAFQVLQLQKDAVHGYIRNQIKLIEGELMQLTKLEIKRRNLNAENLQEALVEQRTALSDFLQQLLKQRDQREQELQQILAEIELKSESNQQNYWMIQYQRLLDAKPVSLHVQEAGIEGDLVSLLSKLSAQHYLPILAHHRVTAEALRYMSSSDLRKVHLPYIEPSGAAEVHHSHSGPLTCMSGSSQVIFLPCGHVCCCQVCSNALLTCPLCRSNISQRIRLFHS
uniref:Leucine rich repeat and sterile alpha motif containing 1 n=1 Tax=Echeneis naucrates TaxID=173247 RepID=A0A665V962_ECHNA